MATGSEKTWIPPVPRPLQQLFDHFPLVTYSENALPLRAPSTTTSEIPTLYVFISEEDAARGGPSFNPSCLKWQTFLKLAGVRFRVAPSTNHASPTGALPFLLPPRNKTSGPTTAPTPSSKLHAYALRHGATPPPTETSSLRLDAYQALIDVPIRNAWLQALYLDPAHRELLDRFYITPASSSTFVRRALRRQLHQAAEREILKTSSGPAAALTVVVDEENVYVAARDALEALAGLLGESATGWFFGAEAPTLFDASVFAYTHLMLEYMSDGEGEADSGVRLGVMVRQAGNGELEEHWRRMKERLGWVGDDRPGEKA